LLSKTRQVSGIYVFLLEAVFSPKQAKNILVTCLLEKIGHVNRVARFFMTQYTKIGVNIPYILPLNYQMAIIPMYQTAVIYSKWPKNTTTFSIPKPSQIYPN
jgi:hypothetical protein